MSLINDALKRAKQAQKDAQAPPPSLQFRPVEPGQKKKAGLDWVVPAIVAVIGIFALVFMWPRNRDALNGPLETKARTLVVSKAEPAAPAKQPEPIAQPVPEKPSGPIESGTSPVPAPSDLSAKAASPPEPPPTPQPPPIRLQAIVYSPTRPSAIINGRTVFVGDRVGDLRVTRITQETTTLSGAGQTNVLTLIP